PPGPPAHGADHAQRRQPADRNAARARDRQPRRSRMMDASYALLVGSMLSAGTVLALASLGLLINEKAGIVNLGAEGMMLCAAIAGFAVTVHSGSAWLGFAAGMLAGAVLAAGFGLLVIWLNANQYASGLALSLFGVGFSAFVGRDYVQARL